MKLPTMLLVILFFYSKNLAAKQIHIGVPNIIPFAIDSTEGTQVDWWKEVAKRSGLDVNIQVYPLARLRASLTNNVIDLAIFGPGAIEQKGVVDLLEHQEVRFVIYHRDHSKTKLAKIKGLNVGTIIGASGVYELSQQYNFVVTNVVSYSALIDMYIKGRVDAIYGIQTIIEYYYTQRINTSDMLPNAIPIKSVINTVRASEVFYKNHPEIIIKIKEVARKMVAEQWQSSTLKKA